MQINQKILIIYKNKMVDIIWVNIKLKMNLGINSNNNNMEIIKFRKIIGIFKVLNII